MAPNRRLSEFFYGKYATFSQTDASTNSWKYEANKKPDSPYHLKILKVDL